MFVNTKKYLALFLLDGVSTIFIIIHDYQMIICLGLRQNIYACQVQPSRFIWKVDC